MLPSANASGEEQKPCGGCQGEAVEPHHKCPTHLHTLCSLPAPGMATGRNGRGRGGPCCSLSTVILHLQGFSCACSFDIQQPCWSCWEPREAWLHGVARGEVNANLVLQGAIFLWVLTGLWDSPATLSWLRHGSFVTQNCTFREIPQTRLGKPPGLSLSLKSVSLPQQLLKLHPSE